MTVTAPSLDALLAKGLAACTQALAAYEDRYVIPTARREWDEDAYVLRGQSGFGFHEATQGRSKTSLFGAKRPQTSRPTGAES